MSTKRSWVKALDTGGRKEFTAPQAAVPHTVERGQGIQTLLFLSLTVVRLGVTDESLRILIVTESRSQACE